MHIRREEQVQLQNILSRIRKKVDGKTRRPWFDLQRHYYVPKDDGLIKTIEDLQTALEHFHVMLSINEADLLFRIFPATLQNGVRMFNWKLFTAKLFPTDNATNRRQIHGGRFTDEEEAYAAMVRKVAEEKNRLPRGMYQHQDLPSPPPFSYSNGYEKTGSTQNADLAQQLLAPDIHAPSRDRGNIFAPPPPPSYLNRPRSATLEQKMPLQIGSMSLRVDRHKQCHTLGYPRYQSALGAMGVRPGAGVDTKHVKYAQRAGIL